MILVNADQVRLRATFTRLGALADPTAVTVTVKDPAGTKTVYTYAGSQIVKDSTGVYHYDLTVNQAGTWTYRWRSTGVAQAVGLPKTLIVREDPLA